MAESNEKGKSFENRVKALFLQMGYQVASNRLVGAGETDLVLTKKDGFLELHGIVECKAYSKNVGIEDVDKFIGRAYKAAEVGGSFAVMVSKTDFTKEARASAEAVGRIQLVLMTYDELLAKLLDFGPFVAGFQTDYELDPVSSYYVQARGSVAREPRRSLLSRPPSATASAPSNLMEYVEGWVHDPADRPCLAILGEFGMGKSSFAKHLVSEAGRAWLDGDDRFQGRIALLFELNRFPAFPDVEEFITAQLANKYQLHRPSLEAFKTMNRAGAFLIVFDGFDEMATQVDAETLLPNVRRLLSFALELESRIIITSRPEYFLDSDELEQVFHSPRSSKLATRGTTGFQRVNLEPFTPLEVQEYLRRRLEAEGSEESWEDFYDRMCEIYDLSDLARRPVFLEMITRTLPQLLDSYQEGQPIKSTDLYEAYIQGELDRQQIDKPRRFQISDDDRLGIVQHLAVHFYRHDLYGQGLDSNRMLAAARRELPPKLYESLEGNQREFLSCSFLVRKGSGFDFAHLSFIEYFVARAVLSEITSREKDLLGSQLLKTEVRDFVAEMGAEDKEIRKLLQFRVKRAETNRRFLHSNALMLLVAMGADLRGASLENLILVRAALAGGDFSRAVFDGSALTEVDFTGGIFTEADFSKASLTRVTLREIGDITGITLANDHVALGRTRGVQFVALQEGISLGRVNTEVGFTSKIVGDGAGALVGCLGQGTGISMVRCDTGKVTYRPITEIRQPRDIAFHPTAAELAIVGGSDLEVWSSRTWENRTLDLGSGTGGARCVAFDPGGERMAVGGRQMPLVVFRCADWTEEARLVNDPGETVTKLAFVDPTTLAVSSFERALRVVDATNGELLWSPDVDGVTEFARGREDALVVGTSRGLVTLVGREGQIWSRRAHDGAVLGLTPSRDGGRIYSVGADQVMVVLDAMTGEVLDQVDTRVTCGGMKVRARDLGRRMSAFARAGAVAVE